MCLKCLLKLETYSTQVKYSYLEIVLQYSNRVNAKLHSVTGKMRLY